MERIQKILATFAFLMIAALFFTGLGLNLNIENKTDMALKQETAQLDKINSTIAHSKSPLLGQALKENLLNCLPDQNWNKSKENFAGIGVTVERIVDKSMKACVQQSINQIALSQGEGAAQAIAWEYQRWGLSGETIVLTKSAIPLEQVKMAGLASLKSEQ